MSGQTQPIEPVFAQCLSFGTGIFGLVKIVGNHQRDYLDLKTDNSQVCYTLDWVTPGTTKYTYDATEGTFTVDPNGTYYAITKSDLNSYPTAATDIREVLAKIRPVEIRFADRKFYDASKVYLRIGIAKQVLLAGTETDATLCIFDGSLNLSNQTNATTDVTTALPFKTYELQEDVNGGVATARVNGLCSYLLTQLPLATDTDTGCSFEVGMTNEGRVFDYMIIAKASERGQQ